MKLYELLTESTSLETTIKAIIADTGNPVSALYSTLKQMAERFFYNNAELKGFALVAGGVGSRWIDQIYFNKLQKELYDLHKYAPKHTAGLKKFLGTNPASFKKIADELPEVLLDVANGIKHKELANSAKRWMQMRRDYEQFLGNLGSDNTSSVKKSPAEPSAVGQQKSQVERIVSDVLSKLPKNISGDIRNAIARSPNKLLALRQELEKRNIKIGESLKIKESKIKAKKVIPPSKPRNPVVRQQQTSGAGTHKDKKKAAKQGYEKHKGKVTENIQSVDDWKAAVLQAYPQYADKIKFKGRGLQINAEIPGVDRSFGVYDLGSESGEVLHETATAGATSAGNVAVGAIYKNKPGKTPKNKNGTAKNALDMKGVNLLTGGSIKR